MKMSNKNNTLTVNTNVINDMNNDMNNDNANVNPISPQSIQTTQTSKVTNVTMSTSTKKNSGTSTTNSNSGANANANANSNAKRTKSSSRSSSRSKSRSRSRSRSRSSNNVNNVTSPSRKNKNNKLPSSSTSSLPQSQSSSVPSTFNSNSTPTSTPLECDYDRNPTKLYLSIQHKRWNEVNSIIQAHPEQTKIWVSRREEEDMNYNNHNTKKSNSSKTSKSKPKLRWKLLPLHAAIIFKAPETTIQHLLTAHPRATAFKDDQGMLPIHLALRNVSSEMIVTMLLVAYPGCVHVGDRKNRTPLHVVQMSKGGVGSDNGSNTSNGGNGNSNGNGNGNMKETYLKCIEYAKYYANVASTSYNEFKMHQLQNDPNAQININNLSTNTNDQSLLDVQKLSLLGKVEALSHELSCARTENQLLVDTVAELRNVQSSNDDSEEYLLSKISNLEHTIKEMKKDAEFDGIAHKRRVDGLEAEHNVIVSGLKSEIDAYKEEIELHKQIADEKNKSLEIAMARQNDSSASASASNFNSASNLERQQLTDQVKKLEVELASSLTNAAVLENQLKVKIQNEHSLARQVSELANKLSESALMTTQVTAVHQKKIQDYQTEKAQMKIAYDTLCNKLHAVLLTMEDVMEENERMVNLSKKHEEMVSEAWRQQEELAAHAARHEQSLIDAAWEREEIVRILTRQAEEVQKSSVEREMLMRVVKSNNEHIMSSEKERMELVHSISKQMGLMGDLKKDVRDVYMSVTDDMDGISTGTSGSDKENLGGSSGSGSSTSVGIEVSADGRVGETGIDRNNDTAQNDRNRPRRNSISNNQERITNDRMNGNQKQQQQQHPSMMMPTTTRNLQSTDMNNNNNQQSNSQYLEQDSSMGVETDLNRAGSVEMMATISTLSSSRSGSGDEFDDDETDNTGGGTGGSDDTDGTDGTDDDSDTEDEEEDRTASVSREEFQHVIHRDFDKVIDDNDGDNTEEDALAEISMNVKNLSLDLKERSIDDVESSVDNLCKEAAALIASIPSPTRKNWS